MPEDVIIMPAEDVQEELVEVAEEPVETPEPVPVPLNQQQAAYEYFRQNPEEHAAMLRAAKAIYEPDAGRQGPPSKPNADDYATYEEYFKAKDEYDEWRLDQRVKAVRDEYEPVIQSQTVQAVTRTLSARFDLPAESQPFLEQILAQAAPAMLNQLANDPISSEILARASRDFAREKGRSPSNGTPNRLNHAEPVSGIGPMRIQLTPNTSEDDLNVYLKMTGKDIRDKAVQAECRKNGYIQ